MLYDVMRSAVMAVDDLTRQIAVSVGEAIAEFGDDPMTMRDAQRARRTVRAILLPIYGPERSRSTSGQMFRTLLQHHDLATHDAISIDARLLDDAMANIEFRRWQAVRSGMATSDDAFAQIMTSMGGPHSQAERMKRSLHLRSNTPWVPGEQVKLSDRVWSIRTKQRVRIDRALRDGVRRGHGPETIARRLERYLNPDYAPVRYEPGGRIIRVQGMKGGEGANAARTLARTEVQHMHHEATRAFVDEMDVGAGVRWALSNAHPRIDICDDLARRSSRGYPRGVYTPQDFPMIPHPRCLCSAEPWLPSREQILAILERRYTS